jgi:hypothetical protein
MKEEAMNQTLECRVLRFLELQLRVQISVGVVLKIRDRYPPVINEVYIH